MTSLAADAADAAAAVAICRLHFFRRRSCCHCSRRCCCRRLYEGTGLLLATPLSCVQGAAQGHLAPPPLPRHLTGGGHHHHHPHPHLHPFPSPGKTPFEAARECGFVDMAARREVAAIRVKRRRAAIAAILIGATHVQD